ncbi:malto-oligosyltrehalose synthase [Xanthobacter sp. V4C-4]|uniref:malto-oligosyltrehalose synthase n=1 Tax=Xanthobacter cornucopiae TaxID=3119924 RepID=UPI00372CA7BD
MTVPRGTIRLQFHQGFPLDAAVAQVDYFADLGLSHVVASPILATRPGLAGGVVDHDVVCPRLGGEAALQRLVTALRRRQMGLILDLAPGHMAVGGADNASWLDLLEWGRDSARAPWFDVDWQGADAGARDKLLVPLLDRPYGAALAAGALQLTFDAARGAFLVRHQEHAFPISPLDYGPLLEAAGLSGADRLAAPFIRLPRLRPPAAEVAAARQHLCTLAAKPEGRALVAAAIGAFDGRDEAGRARLHRLLERQAYRLSWWGTAADAQNWRRHPDSPLLAAIRVERPDVFDATHGTVVRLFGDGLADGFVIQNWDLLADPAGYARRLRLKLEGAASRRPAGLSGTPYLVAATVAEGETARPRDWGVAGTSGAEAQEALGAVLHDPAGATALSDLWTSTTGERQRYDDQRAAARRQALRASFGGQLKAVARALHAVALSDLHTRDITLAAVERVVSEVAVALTARRTYAGLNGFDAADAALFATALARARRWIAPLDAAAADHLAGWLGGEAPRQMGDFERAGAREHAITAFQQLTAALDRVAMDDMLLYRYGRLVSRNEPGADPARLGLGPEDFHTRMAARAVQAPHGLTSTAGPGRKRGEDARMRLAVLSAVPREWDSVLRQMLESTRSFRSRLADGAAPEPADAVILLQTLVGAWPLALRPDDALGLGDLHDRLQPWWLKAIRAARRRTGPLLGDPGYEHGCAQFLSTLLQAPAGAPARRLIADTVARLASASVVNALSHTVLKHTVPGVPELAQGAEFWDLGLEDGDSARAVDYLARGASLTVGASPQLLLETFHDGRVKQATIARLLRLRAAQPALFRDGNYQPLAVDGPHAAHALAFARRHRDALVVTVVTRLAPALLGPEAALPRVAPGRWDDTRIRLPDDAGDLIFRDALTGRELSGQHGHIELAALLHAFPAAVLVKS